MLKKQSVSGQTFVADQSGIDQLKNEFLKEARQFVYLRKGEWKGILQLLIEAREWLQANPEWIPTILALYPPTRQMLMDIAKATGAAAKQVRSYFGKPSRQKRLITVRVICSEVVNPRLIREWEEMFGQGSVATVQEAQVGPFRYFVNERRYAIFCRLGPDDLRGIMGNDQQTITVLRYRFDQEFVEASIRRGLCSLAEAETSTGS